MNARTLKHPTLLEAAWPAPPLPALLASPAAFALLIALSSRLALPLPGTPVPVTAQTFTVLYAGALLGSRRGAAAVALFLAGGWLGLPFFAPVGAHTAGYLLGFLAAAWCTGRLAERGWGREPGTALAMMLAGNALIYVFGLAWLSRFVPEGRVFALGLYPFIPGDLAKAALAAALLPLGWRVLRRP